MPPVFLTDCRFLVSANSFHFASYYRALLGAPFYEFSQVLLGTPSSLLSFLLAPVVNAEEEGARSSFRVAFLETCVSYSDIGAGRENKTPPPMHRSRCLGWTCDDTSKEAKLHGRQCPSSCVITSEVSEALLRRVPNAAVATILRRPPTREI